VPEFVDLLGEPSLHFAERGRDITQQADRSIPTRTLCLCRRLRLLSATRQLAAQAVRDPCLSIAQSIEQFKGIEMSIYLDLKAKIRTLQAQAELARRNEMQSAITEIQKMIAEFDLKPEDVFADIQNKTRRIRRRAPALVKYRDPASGAVWSGRGRAPRWIAGQDREKFLIHTPT